MRENLSTRIPTPEDRKKEDIKSLLEALGLEGTEEERVEIETNIACLREEIEKSPKVGRMFEQGKVKRNEFIIPLVSKEQETQLLETLSNFGIFPWKEQGLLIIERKSDLRKLELAGIARHAEYREEKPKTETAVGPDVDAKRFAFPLPQQEPVERRVSSRLPEMEELLDEHAQDPGIDTELVNVVRKFDAGLLDDDEPEFTRTFGLLPTLTLFPHKYVWDKKAHTHTNVVTGEVLGVDEEAALLEKAQQGNARAANEFIRMHIGFVLHFVKKVHEKFGGDMDAQFQDGLVGLEYAMRKYDPKIAEVEDSKFSSYAAKCVEGYIRSGLAAERTVVHVPAAKRREVLRLRTKEEKKRQLEGPTFGHDEDQRQLLIALERLETRLLIGARFDPVESHFNDEAWQQQDYFGRDLTSSPEQDEHMDAEILKQRVKEMLLTLNPREEMVIRLRFGLGEYNQSNLYQVSESNSEGLTLEAIGEIMGVGKERIRQIEAKALRKMKHPSKSIKLSGFYTRYSRRGLEAPEDQVFEVRGTGETASTSGPPVPERGVGKIGFRKKWTSLNSLEEELRLDSAEISRRADTFKEKHPEWFNENSELHEDLVETLKKEARELEERERYYGFRNW